jgi:hypothetical protein
MQRRPEIQNAILAHLRASARPEPSRALAARFLRIAGGDEETCRRLLAPLLLPVPGVVHVPGAGWILRPPAVGAAPPASGPRPPDARGPGESPRGAAPRGAPPAWPEIGERAEDGPGAALDDFVALASDGGGPGGSGALRAVSLLPVIAGAETQEEHFPAWAAEIEAGSAPRADYAGFPGAPAIPGAPGLSPTDLREILEAIGGLPVVCHRVAREVEPLRRACAAAGLAFAAPVISGAKLGHLLLGLKAGHALGELAGRLAIETRGPDDCRGRVRTVAVAYLRLLSALREKGIQSLAALLEYQDMPAPPLDLTVYAFTAADLRAIPPRPGVYVFLDAAGQVLYVGKAKNLRLRVGSYFTPAARGTAKGLAILERARSFRVEPAGSELEATLLEAALIQEHRPPLNRQFDVHERPAPYGPRLNLVVVLPDTGPDGVPAGTCTLHSMQGGRYLGRARGVCPPGPGSAADAAWSLALDRLEADYFGAPPAVGAGPAAAPRRAPHLDWQLVGSFLRRRGDALHVLDVDECASGREVRERLEVLARAALRGAGKVVVR